MQAPEAQHSIDRHGSSMSAPRHFHSLDALRGVAALAVVFWHWQNFFLAGEFPAADYQAERQPLYELFRVFYASGNLAVDLFFSLSGFIFFWLYAHKVHQQQISAGTFFVLRFSRLYPLHLCTLLLVAVGQAVYGAQHGGFFVYPFNDLWHFCLNLLLIPSVGLEEGFSFNAPVWSVGVEALLYLSFFIFCRGMRARMLPLLLLSLVGFFLISRFYLPIGRGVGSFFLGGAVFLAYRWVMQHADGVRIAQAVIVAAAGLWVVVVLAIYRGWSLTEVPGLARLAWKFPMMVLFPLTILALALAQAMRPTLGARWSFLGDISYSSYLLHFPLQLLFVNVMLAFGLSTSLLYQVSALLLFFALLIPLSMASHRYLEMPAQAWLRQRWARAPSPAAALGR